MVLGDHVITAIDDYTDSQLSQEISAETAKQSIDRLVKKPEKYSGWAYSKLRQEILEYDNELKQYLHYFGVKNVTGSGYEIHHIDKSNKHLIEEGHCKLYYDIIRMKLEQGEQSIKDEIKNIVIIPSWFHKRCENNKTIHSIALLDRKSYYIELRNCLLKLQDNRTKKQKKTKKEYKVPIKSLQFDNSDIHSAVKILEKLALIVTEENKEQIIKELYKCYNYIKKCILTMIKNTNL